MAYIWFYLVFGTSVRILMNEKVELSSSNKVLTDPM